MSANIRAATRDDVEALIGLYEAAGLGATASRGAALAAWDRVAALPDARVLLALDDAAQAAGTLTLFVLPLLAHGGGRAALVESVAVHPRAQRRGIGRALMGEALRIAREAGCYKLALSSNAMRSDAHRFYERLGYTRHGISFVAWTGAA